jgi:uncharacterized protein YhdP
MTADGEWVNNPGEQRTSLKGDIKGNKRMRQPISLASARRCAVVV